MGLIYVSTLGLIIWLVMWAIGVKSFDAFLLTLGLVMVAIAGRVVKPYLPGRQNT